MLWNIGTNNTNTNLFVIDGLSSIWQVSQVGQHFRFNDSAAHPMQMKAGAAGAWKSCLHFGSTSKYDIYII